MTDQTKIEWTDFTVNAWEGCQKVGPGCDHCYAEARDIRFTGGSHWGPGAPRRQVKGGLAKLRKIERDAPTFHAAHGRWPRVFCSSLSDVFDNAVPPEWRMEFLNALENAKNTRPQLLTKRIGNVKGMVPAMWLLGHWPSHIGLMITVVNQAEADRDIPKLLALKAELNIPWVGLSMEPLLGPVDLSWLGHDGDGALDALNGRSWGWDMMDMDTPPDRRRRVEFGRSATLDWIIVGGESGRVARPMHPDWVRSIRDQCKAAGTPFLFKQIGEWTAWQETGSPPYWQNAYTGEEVDRHCLFPADMDNDAKWDDGLAYLPERHAVLQRVGKARAGRLLDGRTWDGVPT